MEKRGREKIIFNDLRGHQTFQDKLQTLDVAFEVIINAGWIDKFGQMSRGESRVIFMLAYVRQQLQWR